jgi:tripeptide aminopeptidase
VTNTQPQIPAEETLRSLIEVASMKRAFAWIDSSLERFVDELVTLSEIPAPTFSEGPRAAHIARRFRELGLERVEIDGAGNVLGCLGGGLDGRGTAFMAHLDTVFSAETDVQVTRREGRLYGPGIGDNGAGLAGLLLMLEAMREAGIELQRPLWLVASTGEEGLGDLCGARAAMQSLTAKLSSVVAIEGALLGRVTHEAVGSLRWNVHFAGPGGHSWHDFGRPSAINAAAAAVAAITRLEIQAKPRTTFNVGQIAGGSGVNVIASDASFLLDMRSTDAASLAAFARRVDRIIRDAAQHEGVNLRIETVGERPAGAIARQSPLVQTASAVLRLLGIEPRYEAASTDANIPLSQGIPAITVGITHGGGIHTEAEWLELGYCTQGVRQLLLLATALSARGDLSPRPSPPQGERE